MAKKGLGRGLEALIPPGDPTEGQVVSLAIDRIDPNPWQPRRRVDQAALEELAASIREHGVVQPIVVCRTEGGRYRLVAGERRWRACQLLGWDSVPAIVRELSDRESTEMALVENLQREDLNPLEEASAYRMLQEEFGLTQEEIARRVGKSRAVVANTLRLLQLPPRVQQLLSEGWLSAGHGRALLAVEDAERLVGLAEEVAAKGLSVRETEDLVRAAGRQKAARPARARQQEPEWAQAAQDLSERLGTRVRIVSNREGRGRIEIEFYGPEDLDRLLVILTG
ncbi:MAG: ParB/RepB/Spo0J family partition protein [Moorellales bacterium]